MKTLEQMSLRFVEDAGDGGQSPVLIRFMKLCGLDASSMQRRLELVKRSDVPTGQMNVGRVMVRRSTIGVSMFKGSVASLNSLLREWEVAARDGVKVVLVNLHDCLISS